MTLKKEKHLDASAFFSLTTTLQVQTSDIYQTTFLLKSIKLKPKNMFSWDLISNNILQVALQASPARTIGVTCQYILLVNSFIFDYF